MFRSPSANYGVGSPPSVDELVKFLTEDETNAARTLFVGNLDNRVDRKLLYELMIQAGPVESIRIVPPRENLQRTIAFVCFEHAVSVRYAQLIFKDVALFKAQLSLNYSSFHKGKPRPEYPPYAPTFFELPIGLENISEGTKQTMVQAQALPSLGYHTGYFVLPEQASRDDSRDRHRSHGRDFQEAPYSRGGGPQSFKMSRTSQHSYSGQHSNSGEESRTQSYVHCDRGGSRQESDGRRHTDNNRGSSSEVFRQNEQRDGSYFSRHRNVEPDDSRDQSGRHRGRLL